MSTNEPQHNERIDSRDERALTQYLTVLDDTGRTRDADGLYLVVSESESEYLVDERDGACECPDHRHRDVRCKHLRRVAYATGEPQVAAADGAGIIDAGDDGVILDEGDDGPEWVGPFTEYDQYGEPTGERFVRCPECGVEVLESDTSTASHRPACRFAADGSDDGRREPVRSEPADFGGGESTGVQDL